VTAPRRVLVLGARFGGCDRAADAIAEALLHAGAGLLSVETADFFKRFAPRLSSLAALAHRTDAAFMPDGGMSLLELTRSTPDSPAARELSSGAVATLESVVRMLEPAAVVSTHQVAGAAAAELRPRHDFVAATVVCDLLPARLWAHPGTDLFFVAAEEVRERAALLGVEWDRIAVTGVPCRSSFLEGRPRARTGTRVAVALVAPEERPATRRELLRAMEEAGADPKDASDGDPGPVVRLCDLAVCAGGGELLWSACAAGVPLVLLGEAPAAERSGADLLVAAGAALPARDAEQLASLVGLLVRRPERLAALREAARSLGRPQAARAIAERVVASLRG
jgi:processive 1,2-diacylglycerol beta-glucosyltransferase